MPCVEVSLSLCRMSVSNCVLRLSGLYPQANKVSIMSLGDLYLLRVRACSKVVSATQEFSVSVP